MKQLNHYKTLQVDAAAEPEVITAAYRRLAQKYHPDTNPSPGAKLRMQAINQAYMVLRDPATRAQHDNELAAQLAVVETLPDVYEQRLQTIVETTRRQAWQEWQQQTRATATAPQRRTRVWLALAALCVLGVIGSATVLAVLQPRWSKPQRLVAGTWDGEWTNEEGEVLSCRFIIRVTDRDDVGGTAIWILKDTPHIDDQLQVGRQATVYVKGTFEPQHRFITMGSYRQDDPYDIVDVNEYRLYLSTDNSTLSGELYNDGVWQGKVVATRIE